MSKDKSPEKKPVYLNEVWEQFDDNARALVIELLAHLGYQHAVARHEESTKGDKDVSSRRDSEDHTRPH